MDDLLAEFLTETNESLSVLDVELVRLEQNPDDPELLGNIFRLVHTIKGTCGFLGLPRLETLAHALETVLGKIRDGEIRVTPDAVTLILESLDGIKAMLADLGASRRAARAPSAAGKMRRQPIGTAWARLPRLVRELASGLGKKIELRMRGADTEIDREVLEAIRDSLIHMVRNAGDHGIEPPAERAAQGKPETGTIALEACHEGGHIVIGLSDDGRGLDIDRIKRKALSTGLASEAELAAMSEPQIRRFILKPGFSTASRVTRVSGRGVGLDAVRANLERIGGSLEMRSESGRGSAFTIKIPLPGLKWTGKDRV